MTTANIKFLGRGSGDTKFEIDGQDITSILGATSIRFKPGSLAHMELDIHLMNCNIDAESTVSINAIPVSYAIGKEVYMSLKKLYEPQQI